MIMTTQSRDHSLYYAECHFYRALFNRYGSHIKREYAATLARQHGTSLSYMHMFANMTEIPSLDFVQELGY